MKKREIKKAIKQFNIDSFNSFNDAKNISVSMNKAINNDWVVKNSSQAHIVNSIFSLEEQLNNNELIEKVKTEPNKKTDLIHGVSFPNIFIQIQFMDLVKNNKSLLKLKSVKYLYDYFKKNNVCLNCSNCYGACYNNKHINMYKDKAISDLRTLLAFIIDKEGLKKHILKATKFMNLFRININGEIHSKEMLEFWLEITKINNHTRFYTYTKSYELFEEYLSKGNKLPTNFFLNISVFDNEKAIKKVAPTLWNTCQKFEIVIKPTNRENTVLCGGNCTDCEKSCYSNLGSDTTIEVIAH